MPDDFDEFFGAQCVEEGSWDFLLGRELHGAFGGAFGGAVAACAIRVARSLAPDRQPSSLDIRFLRSLPPGTARATASMLNAGRSLSTVSVDVVGSDGKHASRATVGLVDVGALHPGDVVPDHMEPPSFTAFGKEWRAPAGLEIPILETLRPTVESAKDRGVATVLTVPWEQEGRDAEACCLAADMCVGPPVAAANREKWIPHPNPDLSLRFTGGAERRELVGLGRLERIEAGLALVRIEVWAGGGLLGIGVSSSMLLAGKRA